MKRVLMVFIVLACTGCVAQRQLSDNSLVRTEWLNLNQHNGQAISGLVAGYSEEADAYGIAATHFSAEVTFHRLGEGPRNSPLPEGLNETASSDSQECVADLDHDGVLEKYRGDGSLLRRIEGGKAVWSVDISKDVPYITSDAYGRSEPAVGKEGIIKAVHSLPSQQTIGVLTQGATKYGRNVTSICIISPVGKMLNGFELPFECRDFTVVSHSEGDRILSFGGRTFILTDDQGHVLVKNSFPMSTGYWEIFGVDGVYVEFGEGVKSLAILTRFRASMRLRCLTIFSAEGKLVHREYLHGQSFGLCAAKYDDSDREALFVPEGDKCIIWMYRKKCHADNPMATRGGHEVSR